MESFYAIGKLFGYEGEAEINPRCVTELSAVMFDHAFVDYHEFMDMVERLLRNTHEDVRENCQAELDQLGVSIDVPGDVERLSYDRCLEIANESLPSDRALEWGHDLPNEAERAIGESVGGYYFVVDWPAEVRDFYVQRKDGGRVAKAFDLMHPEMELMSGSQREHRKQVIVDRVESEPKLDPEKLDYYLEAFDHGLPPHSGGGMGLGRLLMSLLDLDDVRETIFFPRDRDHVVP